MLKLKNLHKFHRDHDPVQICTLQLNFEKSAFDAELETRVLNNNKEEKKITVILSTGLELITLSREPKPP